jgi:DNA transformation protein
MKRSRASQQIPLKYTAMNKLRGIGPKSIAMLETAGITTEEALRALGSVHAFCRVKAAGCKPSLNLLWALEGALSDMDWREAAQEHRTSLLGALDEALKRQARHKKPSAE